MTYRQAKKRIFMHYDSAMPLSTKINAIKNEDRRIEERCSTSEEKRRHREDLKEMLRENAYPEDKIKYTQKKRRGRRTERQDQNERYVYFKFPFVSDRIHHQVRTIFRKNDLPVRVYDNNFTLRNALKKNDAPPAKCNINNCTMKNNLCHTKKCVYELRCEKCQQIYIGSTLRALHIRVREHMEDNKSSVFQHTKQCAGANFSTSVIARARDNTSLRFKEALLIQRKKPRINVKRENDELLSLTFH